MYHYIRDKSKTYPYYNSLQKKKFIAQVKKFSKTGFICSLDELFSQNNKYLLTFDDGLKDHIFAAEILKKNNATGIFFIPTLPLKKNIILDVHKTHLLIGKFKGYEILNELEKYLSKYKVKSYINSKEKYHYKTAYKNQKDEDLKKEFKRIMNYYGDLELKKKILDYLLKKFEINIKPKDYYLNKSEIKHIESLGMIIGSHAESHTLLSRLNYKKQFAELKNSKTFLEKIIKKDVDTFCYPYGGRFSYNNYTLNILKKLKYKLAFSVNYKDVSFKEIIKKPFELPRYDCNLF